jgi:hypothetical protein
LPVLVLINRILPTLLPPLKNPHLIGVHVSSFNSQSFSRINIAVTGEDETEGANFTKGETVSLDNIFFENFVLKAQEQKA